MRIPVRPNGTPISTTNADRPPSSSAVFSPLKWLCIVVSLRWYPGSDPCNVPAGCGVPTRSGTARAGKVPRHSAHGSTTRGDEGATRRLKGEGAAFGAAAGPAQFGDVDEDRLEAAGGQGAAEMLGLRWEHHRA